MSLLIPLQSVDGRLEAESTSSRLSVASEQRYPEAAEKSQALRRESAGIWQDLEAPLEWPFSTSPWMQGPSLACLAYHAMHEGNFDRAGRFHEEALDLSRRQGEKWAWESRCRISHCFGSYNNATRRPGSCARRASSSTRNSETDSASPGASGFFQEPRQRTEARLRGAMEGLLESVGAPVQASYKRWIGDRYLDAMKDRLGDRVFQTTVAEGRTLSLSGAIQFGLEDATS